MGTPRPPRPFTTPKRRRRKTLLETIHHPGAAVMTAAIAIGGLGMLLLSRFISPSVDAVKPADALWEDGLQSMLAEKHSDARALWTTCLVREPEHKDCRSGLKILDKLAAAESAARRPALRARKTRLGAEQDAMRHYENGDYGAALKSAADCLIAEPRNPTCVALSKLSRGRSSAPRSSADDRRQARSHWNVGIVLFQRGEYGKARDEWRLCKQLDPANADCATGLRRIDANYTIP